jgi:two-component system KDP operon response regulator KdpE
MTLRVLLVEDDRELRATLRQALAVEGYDVLRPPACPTHAVLRPCPAGGRVDLVLLDLGLPDGDGEALLATLRRDRGTPVIVISARAGDGSKIRLLDAGADDYLVKPFAIGELLARMRVALRHRGTRGAAGGDALRARRPEVDLAAHRVHATASRCT